MRIIAGEFRGRRLLAPRGGVTRRSPIAPSNPSSMSSRRAWWMRRYTIASPAPEAWAWKRSARQPVCDIFRTDRPGAAVAGAEPFGTEGGGSLVDHSRDLFRWFEEDSPPARALIWSFSIRPTLCAGTAAHAAVDGQPAGRSSESGSHHLFRHDATDALQLDPLCRFDVRDYGPMRVEFLTVG